MAYITKRGKFWQVRISWQDIALDPKTGKTIKKIRSKSKSGFRTKREAEQYGIKLENKRLSGTDISQNPTLYQYSQHYIDAYVKNRVRNQTYESYLGSVKRIKRFFPNIPLKQINLSNFQEFVNNLANSYSKSTIKITITVFSQIIKLAISDGILTRDFTHLIQIPEKAKKKSEVEYLSLKEAKLLKNCILANRTHSNVYPYLIIAALETGARAGELRGLTWDNLYPDKIKIVQQISNDGKLGIPKTQNSIREVPITKDLYQIICELKQNNQKFVFEKPDGSYPTTVNMNTTLKTYLNKCHITKKGFHFHSLRHTHVAILLNANVDILAISKRLGHKNVSTTTSIYAYLVEEKEKVEEKKILSALKSL
ncbi:tyrosine-type recombinase/integrase [Lactobacillus jensenii]|uniref:tyrosine-type recombinase/integrase n=1 Tax=Lactobacillus jensenii TaxID=109790 RepID=UPI0011943EFA|nr:tyrosine-type recombinase/integrase [Lactobacillus jensenii]MDK7308845.1 tyrosine-type recombinase/integrase [Lactobacillus jensenii]TVV22584.1 tyrosine-type recombinase/integrase [Lactobacillus jensenii]